MVESRYMNLKQLQLFLGIGRNTALRLCQERPHSFPAVRIGNRYQIDTEKLKMWKDDWYAGKFNI